VGARETAPASRLGCEMVQSGTALTTYSSMAGAWAKPQQQCYSTAVMAVWWVVGSPGACGERGWRACLKPASRAWLVFVRCDDTRMDIMKALVIGPEGTPYANGCFEFDIYLPPSYPWSPPKVRLVTGNGTVGFSLTIRLWRNLVCRWQHLGRARWVSNKNTLGACRIQEPYPWSRPYFNEPRDLSTQNTPGQARSGPTTQTSPADREVRYGSAAAATVACRSRRDCHFRD
jgi:hypothetical protein